VQLPAQTTQFISIQISPVVASIVGGSRRTALRGSTVTLDASSSYDPDSCPYIQDPATGQYVCSGASSSNSNNSLGFAWECSVQGVICIFKSRQAALSSTSSTVLDLAALVLPSQEATEIIITVSVMRVGGGGGSIAKATIILSISDVPMIDVQIRTLYVTAGRCAYSAVLPSASDGGLKYSWSVASLGSNGGRIYANANDAATFLAGNSGSIFVVRLDSPYAVEFLSAPGASFTISLTVVDSNSGMKGNACFEMPKPVPPSGGTCTATPTAGISLITPFVIRCSDWNSDNLPLSYSFSSRPGTLNKQDAAVSWSTPTAATSYDLYLTPGNYSLAASISDDIGTSSIVDAAEQVLVSTGGNNSKSSGGLQVDSAALSLLADSLVAKGRVGSATIMVDGVASGVNEGSPTVAADCLSNGGCESRRLLSSSAYRMSVRRLLMRKLGRLASIVSGRFGDGRAPAVLRAARRTVAVPSELGWEGATAAIGSLAATLGTLDLRALRSPGAISDAARLGARTLAAVGSNSDGGQLVEMISRVSSAMLGMGQRYVAGMVPGENPVEVQARGSGRTNSGLLTLSMARDKTGPGVDVQWQVNTVSPTEPVQRNMLAGIYEFAADFQRRQQTKSTDFASASLPVGLAVVRMGVALGLPTAGSSNSMAASSQVQEHSSSSTHST
jgi:hypothetical protein